MTLMDTDTHVYICMQNTDAYTDKTHNPHTNSYTHYTVRYTQ